MINTKKSLKLILYKTLTVILCFFWGFFAIIGIANCVSRMYIYPLKNKQTVFEFADLYDLDRALVFSIIKVESSFNPKAESKAGAIGLMQITPATAQYIANMKSISEYDLKDERTNISFGCFYMKYLTKRFENLDTAIVAYNAGEGNVSLWLNNPNYSDDKKTLKDIPFAESKEYIKKIKETFTKYKKLYGNILDK